MSIVIRKYQDTDLDSLNILLDEAFQLSKNTNNTNNIELVAIEDNRVVGFLTISKIHDSIKNIYYAYINYVCVKKEYRRRGIATMLFNHVFDLCHNENILYLELTSNSSRCEAHGLYKKIGFSIRNTNVFRKVIK